ncbi:MAG: hypothetical protein WKH64_18205 [Chloroflexia bacterium]
MCEAERSADLDRCVGVYDEPGYRSVPSASPLDTVVARFRLGVRRAPAASSLRRAVSSEQTHSMNSSGRQCPERTRRRARPESGENVRPSRKTNSVGSRVRR